MLLEYKCKNHRSIRDEVNFSFLATKDSSNSEELITFGKNKFLKKALIYGANGSGKTALIDSLNYFKFLVCSSFNFILGEPLPRAPYKLCTKEPSVYEIQLEKNGIRYAYGVSLDSERILEEYLYFYPNNKKTKIFHRIEENYGVAVNYKKIFEPGLVFVKPNKLLLSCCANYVKLKEVEDVFLFFKQDLIIYNEISNNWFNYSARTLNTNTDVYNTYIKFFNSIGVDVNGFDARIDRKTIESTDLPVSFIPQLKNFLIGKQGNFVNVKFHYNDFDINYEEESLGTKKLFDMLAPIIDILNSDKILVCDELETHLHPLIVKELLRIFDMKNNTNNHSQLLFTTHNERLMDLNELRRDQIWFTEMTNTRSTDLYSLAELKNIRKDENTEKNYLLGKYGSIPLIDKNLVKILMGENDAH